jgi:hypothetical protein
MNSEAPNDGPGGAELAMVGWFVVQEPRRLDTFSLVKKSLNFPIGNLDMRNTQLPTMVSIHNNPLKY